MTRQERSIKTAINSKELAASRHHIPNRQLFNFAAGKAMLTARERQHLHGCQVCQKMAVVLIRQLMASRP